MFENTVNPEDQPHAVLLDKRDDGRWAVRLSDGTWTYWTDEQVLESGMQFHSHDDGWTTPAQEAPKAELKHGPGQRESDCKFLRSIGIKP